MNTDADALQRAMDRIANPWDQHLGTVWDRVEPGVVVEAHVDIDERHLQPYGIVHGGVMCSIVEVVASMAATQTAGRPAVGINNNTDFLRTHGGGRVDARATPIHVGRSQHVWQVEIRRATDNALVARGQVRFQVLDEVPSPRSSQSGSMEG